MAKMNFDVSELTIKNCDNVYEYVICTDTILSGWDDICDVPPISKFAIACNSHEDAMVVYANMKKCFSCKYVRIVKCKNGCLARYTSNSKYHLSVKHFDECSAFNKRGE